MYNTSIVYESGNGKYNEDAYVINEKSNIFAVLDGATGLQEGMPGKLASETMRESLLQENQSLLDLIKQGNEKIADKMMKEHRPYSEESGKCMHFVPKEKRSTTGMAVIQLNAEQHSFEYYHAGDCMLFVQYESGEIRAITYDLLNDLDKKVVFEIKELQEKYQYPDIPHISELRNKVMPLLIENRKKMNTDKGYVIIDGSSEAIPLLESGKISLIKVKNILLLSDGMVLPTENTEIDSWLQSAKIAFEDGVATLKDKVFEKEKNDKHCVRFPRLKTSDDKTGLLIRLDRED